MQIKVLHKNVYKLYRYSSEQENFEKHRKKYEKPVHLWRKLKSEGVSDRLCQSATGISKATYYRYKAYLEELAKGILPPPKHPKTLRKPQWGEAEKQLVLRLRRENPTYGKAKITVILKRDHDLCLSESTVGRILKHLMAKGFFMRSISAPYKKKRRRFKGHAQPLRYGVRPKKPGQMIQLGHMTVSKNNICAKEFRAWDPKSKFIYGGLYTNATSRSAKHFLEELIEYVPFTIESIQVDGGSEFMKEFEEACATLGIDLFVLSPKRPQWNGGVERGNRIFREEFYARKDILANSLDSLRAALLKAITKYNTYRPHSNLNGLTPMQDIQNTFHEAS